MLESLFNKVAFYQKETSAQFFSYEFCETFKSTYFEEHLRTAASISILCSSSGTSIPFSVPKVKKKEQKQCQGRYLVS